jgi:hypothetical protein
MRTTDDIIKDLRGREAAGEDLRQEIIAHEQLARLRAELVLHGDDPQRAATLRTQITSWLRMVSEDVDDRIAERPDKDSVDVVDDLDPVKRPRTGPKTA